MESLEQLAKDIEFEARLVRDDFTDGSRRLDSSGQSHWVVTIIHNGQSYSTEYSQGAAYRDYYSFSGRKGKRVSLPWNGKMSYDEQQRLFRSRPSKPNVTDVMYCLVSDAQCADYGDFDDFCDNLGYDNDSREAERIHRACQDTFFKLRNMFDFERLCELFQDY